MDLRDLYQEVILDHSKSPRNFGEAEDADRTADGNNPLCGDKVTVYLKVAGDTIEDVRFKARGCAISVASASMMTELVKGKSIAEAEALFERFHGLLVRKEPVTDDEIQSLDELAALTGVRAFPTRVKCATLPWHTLRAAIEDTHEEVTTE